MTDARPPLLQLHDITKAYPGVLANDHVNLTVNHGEIHALLGENGAGKSTLVKMIYGLVTPDRGQMMLNGQPYHPVAPRQARAAGVGMVFQHFSLFDALNVAENVALGMEHPPKMRDLAQQIETVSQNYGLPLDPHQMVGYLSAGERQRVEIIRSLLQNPKLLIMDEPTSVLTPQEVDILFATLRQLQSEGTSILYISHKLEEIRALCERATILRRGRVVGDCVPQDHSARQMAEMMVGTSLTPPKRSQKPKGDERLSVKNLSITSPIPFGTSLKNINFSVAAGEILGIAGVAGNGQDELLLALSGELTCAKDTILLNKVPIGDQGPPARRSAGLVATPEERLGHAAAPDMSLVENVLLSATERKPLLKRGFINRAAAVEYADEVIVDFDVRTPSSAVMARALSGGNLQKFIVGRELCQNPDVIVINQPTWGVDAAASAAIRQAIITCAEQGAAVVVISQDLDELLEISDYFCALNAGRLSRPCPVQGLTHDQIGLMMGGAADHFGDHHAVA